MLGICTPAVARHPTRYGFRGAGVSSKRQILRAGRAIFFAKRIAPSYKAGLRPSISC
jgi:hypothetical protein